MSRGQGRVYQRGTVWWLDYGLGGHRRREPTDATTKREATEILRQRIGDRRRGRIIARPEKVLLAEYSTAEDGTRMLVGGLRYLHESRYETDGLRSLDRARQCWDNVEAFFPAPTPVTVVTETRLKDYVKHRLAEGASRQTANHELSALRAGFHLAIKDKLIATAPTFEIPKVANAREGFFEEGDLALVLAALPEYCRRVVTFLRITGWRVNEALTLTWERVDWEQEGIYLSAWNAKGKASRLFPFGLAPDLKAILEAAWKERGRDPFVFKGPRGTQLGYTTLLHHWQRATKLAGCEDRIIHDLRRTAVRDFLNAGVDQRTIMELCGWKTLSVFLRYNIVDQDRLAQAVAKRYAHPNGTVTAQSGLPTATAQ